jgi:putative addiction module component (TIGR02574 family)
MRLTREEILRLSVAERIEMIGDIWDTIPESPGEYPMPEEHQRILEQRLADFERDPGVGLSWEEVRSRCGSDRRQ